ncbi:MAG: hypothetical protein M0Q48_05365 [Verrucomicrobia bacterium]|nr:hypothetical protein [Verrucomicrobiota bacterium]
MKTTIDLKDFFLTKMSIEEIKGKDLPQVKMSLGLSFGVGVSKNSPNLFKVTLGVLTHPEDSCSGLKIEASIDGYFELNPEILNPDEKNFYILVNGSLILYGILRGIVANATGVFRINKFIFPTVMMQEEVKRFFENKDKLNKTKKPKTKEKK